MSIIAHYKIEYVGCFTGKMAQADDVSLVVEEFKKEPT
jgi:hypothetical protein